MDSILAELEAIASLGLRRRMRPIDGSQGAEIEVDGRRAINFSSNNYLGLANHPALAAAAFASSVKHGYGAGASRLIAGSLAPHRRLEHALAEWLGAEAALVFNSGFQANVGVIPVLAGPEDAIFSDALNHASIIDGCRLSRAEVHVYPHLAIGQLAARLAGSRARRKLIVTESVFSMDGDIAPIAQLAELAHRHAALLFVDDAHAIGVLGPEGRGLANGAGADLVLGTLGKAFGTSGAFVAGAAPIIELLVQRARSFVFSTAMPSMNAAATCEALAMVRGPEGDLRRSQLQRRAAQLHAGLSELSLQPLRLSHIHPIFVREGNPARAMALSDALLQRGIFVQGIRPPTVPRGTSRLRLALSATHTASQVDSALRALAAVRSELAAPTELGEARAADVAS